MTPTTTLKLRFLSTFSSHFSPTLVKGSKLDGNFWLTSLPSFSPLFLLAGRRHMTYCEATLSDLGRVSRFKLALWPMSGCNVPLTLTYLPLPLLYNTVRAYAMLLLHLAGSAMSRGRCKVRCLCVLNNFRW